MIKLYFKKSLLVLSGFCSLGSIFFAVDSMYSPSNEPLRGINIILFIVNAVIMSYVFIVFYFRPLVKISEHEIILFKFPFGEKNLNFNSLTLKPFDKGITLIDDTGVGIDVWKMTYSKNDFNKLMEILNKNCKATPNQSLKGRM